MTYRVIDVAREAPQAVAPQAVPQLMWVKVADLVIDDRYQRPLHPRNWQAIRKIAADFRWSAFSPVLVAPVEGGRFAVIDGQHRCHAAAICQVESVPAMVVPIAPEAQAASFAAVNGAVVRMDALNVLRAQLAAGDPLAERCDAIVTAAGCRLMTFKRSAGDRKAGEVFAVGLIRRMVERGHAVAVGDGLSALRRHGGGDDPALWRDGVLTPWLGAVAACPSVTVAGLIACLDAHPPLKVIAKADSTRPGSPEFMAKPVGEFRRLSFVARLRSRDWSVGVAA